MVPPLWLKICGQIGPTGTYNRKSLSAWFLDLLARQKQLKEWSEMSLQLPGSIWIAGLFNPMGYVTACLQVTARANNESLDAMRVWCDVTSTVDVSSIECQPEVGTYVHGFFMEGARWDSDANEIADSFPKDLYPVMPMMHITALTVDKIDYSGSYECPCYTTTIRGPTFVFPAPLRTTCDETKWILAAVALVMQPD